MGYTLADAHRAVEGFNNEIINQYIPKQNLNIELQLVKAIEKSQLCYFNSISLSTLDALTCYQDSPSALMEKEFEIFFREIINSYDVTEYYLLDPTGSFLMLTSSGEIIILYTQNEEQTESYYLDIKDLPSVYFNKREKNNIKERKKIFCYKSFHGLRHPDPSLWKPFYCNAKKIQGENQFYYSIAKNHRDLDLKTIIPFNSYLKDHQLVFD